MSDGAFLQLLRREHRAADSFGNGDGCVSSDEHPEFSLFMGHFGGSTDRVCTSHVLRYARSQAFRQDVAEVRLAHRELMRVITNARAAAARKVNESLGNLSQVFPISRDVFPNETEE